MNYAAQFLCDDFNKLYPVGKWIVWGEEEVSAKVLQPARVYQGEALVQLEIDGIKQSVNPAQAIRYNKTKV